MTGRHRLQPLASVLVVLVAASLVATAASAAAPAADGAISIDYDGEYVTVSNTTGQTIAGSADLEPGTELRVSVQSTGNTTPQFYRQETVTVGDDGRWEAAFDFSAQQAGDRFNVTVEATDGPAAADATGEVVACSDDCATPEPEGLTIDTTDGNVTVANGTSQVISGTADVQKGTEVNVRAQSTGDTQPRFFQVATAVVTADGTWAVTMDFSHQRAGGTFELTASIEDSERSTTAEGHIVACEGDCTDEPPSNTPTPKPAQTQTATPTESSAPVALNGSAVSAVRGEVAAIELSFNEADAAVVTIGNAELVNYELQALVRDADGDGSAVLYLDTALAGREGNPVSVSTGDELTLRYETELRSLLDDGSYDVTVHEGESADGEPTTLGTLLVQERADGTATEGTPTATDQPEQGGRFDGLGGAVVSLLFLGGGAVVALLLVRN